MENTKKRIHLFFDLYRKKIAENIALFLLFSLLSAVVSIVLFVQTNNQILLQGSTDRSLEQYCVLMENVLELIAVAATLIGAVGGIFLIGFRNQAAEKSLVIMHIFGMSKKDLFWKALLDSVIYALLTSCVGYFAGYGIFLKFVQKMLHVDAALFQFRYRVCRKQSEQ